MDQEKVVEVLKECLSIIEADAPVLFESVVDWDIENGNLLIRPFRDEEVAITMRPLAKGDKPILVCDIPGLAFSEIEDYLNFAAASIAALAWAISVGPDLLEALKQLKEDSETS